MKYQDCLQVSVDVVKEAGFKERYPKHKCGTTYYVSEDCEYVLANVSSYGWILMDKETYETIKDINISMNNKGRGRFYVPYVEIDSVNVMLHRVVMNVLDVPTVEVDHINHNRQCCIKENLRKCNRAQNSMNKKRKGRISEYDSSVDDYIAYRDSAKEQYKGTDMEEFVYDIENDFSETLGLLIHHYILGDIKKEDMYQMNLDYWRDKLDNASGLGVAI